MPKFSEDTVIFVCLDCDFFDHAEQFKYNKEVKRQSCPSCEKFNVYPVWRLVEFYNELKDEYDNLPPGDEAGSLKSICSEYL